MNVLKEHPIVSYFYLVDFTLNNIEPFLNVQHPINKRNIRLILLMRNFDKTLVMMWSLKKTDKQFKKHKKTVVFF